DPRGRRNSLIFLMRKRRACATIRIETVKHVLELRNVSKRYDAETRSAGHTAVDGVSLAIGEGELFSLLGPSGCGKTTTLRLIAGFEEATAGEVWLAGKRIDGLRPYERNVTTVFQSYALFPHLTVHANVEFGLRRHGIADCGS